MAAITIPELEKQRKRFSIYKGEHPENEYVILIGYLFGLYDEAVNDGEVRQEQYIAQRINHYLVMLAASLEKGSDLKTHINSLDKLFDKTNDEVWSILKQKYADADRRGSLLLKGYYSRYSKLLNRYGVPRKENKLCFEPTVDIEDSLFRQERLFKCFEAYRYLYLNNLSFMSFMRKGILLETIEALHVAIKSEDVAASETAIAKARELIRPTHIVNIPQLKNEETYSKHIEIMGIAHPFTEMKLLVESEKSTFKIPAFRVGPDGSFNLKNISLARGKNRIEIRPMQIPELLRAEKLFLNFTIECKISAFLKSLIDPFTKDILEDENIEELIRCKICRTICLKISWQANGNKCVLCPSTEYWEHDHPNFESIQK